MSTGSFFSGKNLQLAVLAAARHFDIDPEQLAYRDRTRTTGIVKSAKAVIEVDPVAFRRIEPAPARAEIEPVVSIAPKMTERAPRPPDKAPGAPAPAGTAAPARALSPDETTALTRQSMARLLRLAGVAADVNVSVSRGGRLRVELSTPGMAVDEDLARSFETLLVRVMRGLSGQAPGCRVDWLDAARRQREGELEALAHEAARVALAELREVELQPMDARDRRVVHMVLQDREDVASESRGEGSERRLVVSPSRRFT